MPEARCACGALSLQIGDAEPMVVACHCLECQRRTGSPFGVGAYYPAEAVRISGTHKEYSRPASSGPLRNHFCPDCGSTVFWYTDKHQNLIGIATGSIGDPALPAPVRSVWEARKHHWVEIPALQHFPRGRDG